MTKFCSALYLENLLTNIFAKLNLRGGDACLQRFYFTNEKKSLYISWACFCNVFQTPLHQAVMDDKREMIQLLLRYGADTNIADDSGLSPLSLARNIGSQEILRIFEDEDSKH